jgi:hypothetical protein
MNTKIITILFILIVISINNFSQTESGISYLSGRHDSLLFDGANDISTNFQITGNECLMKAIVVKGNVIGMAMTKVAVVNCIGEVIDSVMLPRKRLLKEGDMVVAGETISTERDNDFVILQLHEEENIMFTSGKNGGGLLGVRDFCRFPPNIWITGKLGIKWNPLLPKSVTLCTEGLGSCIKITGTQLSFETVKDGDVTIDILKVYEGSVVFEKKLNIEADEKKRQDLTAQQAKLSEEFQSGKISMEEFVKKSTEIQKKLRDINEGSKITVNAGFESRITGTDNPTEPVPIDENEKPWWEDPAFNK